MARNIFEENEEREKPLLGEKTITSMMEKAGYAVAAAILLVVILVMATDIKCITSISIQDFSVTFFVLMFCSYFMYLNMYRNGMIAGERLVEYKNVCEEYTTVRDKIKSPDVHKRLSAFCRDYVDNEMRARIEEVLSKGDIAFEDYTRYKHMGKAQLKACGLFKDQRKCIRKAKRIRHIKLTPTIIYKGGNNASRRKVIHMLPSDRRLIDNVSKLISNATSYCVAGVVAFEIFADPSWQTVISVAFKLLMVVCTGYSGYMRGFDNIATDTVAFIKDQIELLNQFMRWEERAYDKQQSVSECFDS